MRSPRLRYATDPSSLDAPAWSKWTIAPTGSQGTWRVEEGAGAGGADVVVESYDRLEYAGALQSAEPVEVRADLTYVGETLRLRRVGPADAESAGVLGVYRRASREAVGEEIARLLASPAERADGGAADAGEARPAWERADLERGRDAGGPPVQTSAPL